MVSSLKLLQHSKTPLFGQLAQLVTRPNVPRQNGIHVGLASGTSGERHINPSLECLGLFGSVAQLVRALH